MCGARVQAWSNGYFSYVFCHLPPLSYSGRHRPGSHRGGGGRAGHLCRGAFAGPCWLFLLACWLFLLACWPACWLLLLAAAPGRKQDDAIFWPFAREPSPLVPARAALEFIMIQNARPLHNHEIHSQHLTRDSFVCRKEKVNPALAFLVWSPPRRLAQDFQGGQKMMPFLLAPPIMHTACCPKIR